MEDVEGNGRVFITIFIAFFPVISLRQSLVSGIYIAVVI
jgi:hypothetical protein